MTLARLRAIGLISVLLLPGLGNAASTADHSQFEQLQQPFSTGPEVTEACLECHTEAASQIHQTGHWTWQYELPTGETVGKQTVLNNFCVGMTSNEPRCTSCHVGYGYEDSEFDFSQESAVDCLVCHDSTDQYKKFPTGAGHPNYEPAEWPKGSGNIRPAVDLTLVAQNVALPERDNCGSCHFYGGGGDAVKHGDLDSSLNSPAFELDVHMSPEGAGLVCQDCHTTDGHAIDGSRFEMTAVDTHGIDIPGAHDSGRATCVSCHDSEPHQDVSMAKRLNSHAEVLACQSCHIPEYARAQPTKMGWDWSTAGKMNDAGKPFIAKDERGLTTYDTKKGDFVWEDNVVPDYAWFNGVMNYTTVGETVSVVDGRVALTELSGQPGDDESRIWPFKIMHSKQPMDAERQVMINIHLFGKDENAYWGNFDWQKAASAGQAAVGVDYSGELSFVETTYHWPITHMVAPKEQAVDCQSCHSKNGRLESVPGLLLPGRDSSSWIDLVGWLVVGLTAVGVILHGAGRMVFASRRRG